MNPFYLYKPQLYHSKLLENSLKRLLGTIWLVISVHIKSSISMLRLSFISPMCLHRVWNIVVAQSNFCSCLVTWPQQVQGIWVDWQDRTWISCCLYRQSAFLFLLFTIRWGLQFGTIALVIFKEPLQIRGSNRPCSQRRSKPTAGWDFRTRNALWASDDPF